MPATRARTCAVRTASIRPGNSVVTGNVSASAFTTLTSGGGGVNSPDFYYNRLAKMTLLPIGENQLTGSPLEIVG